MIKFKLTKKQTRALKKHFEMIHCAKVVGNQGCFVAQVMKDSWDEVAYVRAAFISGERSRSIYDAISRANVPYGYLGVPPVPAVTEKP